MDLRELVKEINYQESFDYDKRVELFNKYKISTTKNFINPIIELSRFILHGRYLTDYDRIGGYSHSGAIKSTFNNELKLKKDSTTTIENNYVRVSEKVIQFLQFDPKDIGNPDRKSRPVLWYHFDDKTISITKLAYEYVSSSFRIERDMYDKIDTFLIDFGYEAW